MNKLAEFKNKPKVNTSTNLDTLSSAGDGKKFKKLLKKLNVKGQEKALKAIVVEYCKDFDNDKKIKFFKEAQIGAKIGKDSEASIKEAVGIEA